MINYPTLSNLLAGRMQADVACPECGPSRSALHSKMARKLRIWRLRGDALSFHCIRCGEVSGFVSEERTNPLTAEQREAMERRYAEARAEERAARERKRLLAIRIWRESSDSIGTSAEDYLSSRGIALPTDAYLRKRRLRFHPACPFRDKMCGPALVVGFTPILVDIPDDPFIDPPVEAIHRIRGRGHDNKEMLGAVRGKAVQLGEWEEVSGCGVLHVAEGIETALALLGRDIRPIWALGSAGEMEVMPIVAYVRRLVVFADNDRGQRGIEAAERLATRYADAGRDVEIRMPEEVGADYADV